MGKIYTEFYEGNSINAYEILGCHKVSDKYKFTVWAPNAKSVSVVGDFNNWDKTASPMHFEEGIWTSEELPLKEGYIYKYAITSTSGNTVLKSDPYGRLSEVRPNTASVICCDDNFVWTDDAWLKKLAKSDVYSSPVNIYEVHVGSWRRHADGSLCNYKELADSLVPYIKDMGYTHIELMPISEHPFDGSWGYQVTGFFAPTSRYGAPDDLRYLVNLCHLNGIGIILDWVPAHFCKDEQGLIDFDGTHCYESSDPTKMEHASWGTRIFDFGRFEVQSFLVSNAIYWLKEFHFDGLRVDAVASMLYLDYDRKGGEWHTNLCGGKENLEAIALLQKVAKAVFAYNKEVLYIAEESTAFPKVTYPTYEGGLGFNYKWNMGWMNDVLRYISTDTLYRNSNHNLITFAMCYAFSENFILPLSHDEVVHLKGALINKVFGDYGHKFAGLKTLLGFMFSHPGKKLTFMGTELAQWNEWSEDKELDWMLLNYPMHIGYHDFVKKLNKTYKKYKPLYEIEKSWSGFTWRVVDDKSNSVLAYERKDKKGNVVLAVSNFSNFDYRNYEFSATRGEYDLILNSDEAIYGGRGVEIPKKIDVADSVSLSIPANSVLYYYCKKK